MDRLAQLGKQYGGNFSGNGISPLPSIQTINRGVYFDPTSNQHFTLNNGQPSFITPPKSDYSNASNISKFAHFVGGVGSQIGHIAGGAASWLGHTLTTAAEAPFKFTYDVTRGAIDTYTQGHQVDQLIQKEQSLSAQYMGGQISKEQFQSGLKDLMSQHDQLNKQIEANQQRLENSRAEGINTAADLVAIVTGGLGKLPEMAASKFLTSVPAIDAASQMIGKVASNKLLFDGLSDGAKQAIQKATAEVIANAPDATYGQIARASAVNLAFKYPLYFSWASGTGSQMYHELDQKKYGDLVRTAAFNAALLLSGGPIGYAVKYAGKGVKGLVGATFGQTSFIDELSRNIGNGDPAGLYNAIAKLPKSEQADVIKQLSAVEATNLGTVGKDAIAAAQRVIRGMENYEGISMKQFSHEEALNNMVNFAKAQRLADEAGKAAGLGVITVGRVDSRALNEISAKLSPIGEGAVGKNVGEAAQRLQAWEQLKAESPTQAWAHNENFDRQIKALIDKYPTATELDNAIRNIKASFSVKGFPESVAKQLSKMGYIPIKPSNLEAPFREGAGQIASKFASNDEFFIKSVQPLPVLKTIGTMFTHLGLSPNGSAQRVYQLFNENLARNLKESGVVPEIMGEDASQTTDLMIKKLSSYAKNPTVGKIASKLPITDLRMLTRKEIQGALDVGAADAKTIQDAISKAFIEVPLSIRGLGDRLVDYVYSAPTGAFQRRYLRLQGAARFGYNPFFQYLRVIPKTETLASFEGGGFISSVFKGQAKQLNEIRTYLKEGKFLEKQSGFTSSSDIASEFSGLGYNLRKRLLPMQEKSIAGLINSQAERLGMDWKAYINQNPQQVRDTIQMIAEYDKRSSFLNSPLARTMNIAFFPFRFDTKVAIIMTRNLAKADLATQVGVVNGLLQAHNYLNTNEGKAWYAANSDAIGLFKYITPVASLNEVFHSLLLGNDHSLGNFGELGGLPFGWIPQLLDSEGLTHFNQPGASPKTGALYTEYIPNSARGQVATAIQDFISGLFSYPGATAGLPSKTKLTSTIARGVTGANSSDFNKVTPTPSPEQQAYQQALNQPGGNPNPNINLPPETQGFTLPAYSLPEPVNILTKEQVAALESSGRSGRRPKAKALPIPPR